MHAAQVAITAARRTAIVKPAAAVLGFMIPLLLRLALAVAVVLLLLVVLLIPCR